ncbi:MAG TPA: HisA/HisF-related TIM barrel protein, partial [Rubrobacter sp.]|nr:HisA/HisF-related TIM barrel protein [Rubrobacter sp.]
VTIEDAFEVYDEVRDAGLRYVGFKDVGLPFDRLEALTETIHDGGQEVMLEVVSEEKEDELRSARAALDLGVDYLLGGTHAEEVSEMLSETGIRYCPFPGRVVGHPSLLRGSIEEIVESARRLTAMGGVRGLDLLAYRYDGDVEALTRAVVEAVEVRVIAAGSVDSEERIRTLAEAGVWGFTVGSAIFEGKFAHNGASAREQVETVLAASRQVVP